MTHGPALTFANHRGVVPMLWAFVVLASCELVGAHLLLGLWSAKVAWVASGLTLLTEIWLVRWVLSWKRLPHELSDDRLRLHMGSLRHIDVPLAAIAGISGAVPSALLKARDTCNLVPVAYPNRLIELRAPLTDRRGTRRIAVRVDDPAAFDAALQPTLAKAENV
jgi:hypothetical protein